MSYKVANSLNFHFETVFTVILVHRYNATLFGFDKIKKPKINYLYKCNVFISSINSNVFRQIIDAILYRFIIMINLLKFILNATN